jgi:Glycosyl transferase family 90
MATAQRLLPPQAPVRRKPTYFAFVLTLLVLSALLASLSVPAHHRLLSSFSLLLSDAGPGPSPEDERSKKVQVDEERNQAIASSRDDNNSNRPQLHEVPESFRMHSFPRWGGEVYRPHAEERKGHGGGIQLSALFQYVEDLVRHDPSVTRFAESLLYVWGHVTPDHDPNPSAEPRPKLGLWASEMLQSSLIETPERFRMVPRFRTAEGALKRAWVYLSIRMNDAASKTRWPELTRVMEGGMGFPILLWHSDFKGCNKNNYRNNMSVPLLTTCAHVRCNYAFPFPSYRTVRESFSTSKEWDAYFKSEWHETPWNLKRNQIVWRGSLTGPFPRIRLGTFAAEHLGHPLIDIGVHRLPGGNKNFSDDVLKNILMLPGMPDSDFTKYKAILDIDGNSWSARFGRLLCKNSVVVKVEPEYVDYFYKHLTPWKHYIPIREDLGDLLETIEWIMDASNEGRVLQIIASANAWCREHMTYLSITYDILDVLNAYVYFLDQYEADWAIRWKSSIARLWDPQSRLDLRRLA